MLGLTLGGIGSGGGGTQPIILEGTSGHADNQTGGITSFKMEIPSKGYTSGILHAKTTYANYHTVKIIADDTTIVTATGSNYVGDYPFTIPNGTQHLYVQEEKYGYGNPDTWSVELS